MIGVHHNQRRAHGFTLIELMIVVAIIAILAAIALPAYGTYRLRAADSACQMEMKNYANFSLVKLHQNQTPDAAPRVACGTATDATVVGVNIIGASSLPGARTVTCDMNNASCSLP